MKELKEIHISKELLINLIAERHGGNLAPARELLKDFDDTFVIKKSPYMPLKIKAIYKEEIEL